MAHTNPSPRSFQASGAPANPSRDEPQPSDSEDSIPQDEGTDNSWQIEPLEKPEQHPAAAKR